MGPQERRTLATLAASGAALYVGDRWGALAEGSRDPLSALLGGAAAWLLPDIASDPLRVSGGSVACLTGLSLFCGVWCCYAWAAGQRQRLRSGDEYGSARRGTVREGQALRDPGDPDNNIVLTRHLGIAIRPNERVRERATSRNVLVIGPTGTGKTAGYVEPNLLQIGARRDMVVVDPKGTTLSRCGMALVAGGVDVSVFDMVHKARSDTYNPLANVRTHEDVNTFVSCLVANTNNGRESTDPIWDNGEILLYRSILTFMLDWCRREDMTMRMFLMLCDLCDVREDGDPTPSPLDLLFSQVETGMRPVVRRRENSRAAGGRTARRREGVSWEPSRLARRGDGLRPASWSGPDGEPRRGLRPQDDLSLRLWHQFRHGAGKTLKSFVISSHARLAQLQGEETLRILGGWCGGRDDLRLETLGQEADAAGRPLPPRVVFVISSDFKDDLNSLLSILMWQAIFLPMEAADSGGGGALPRPVSLVFDEFGNVGKLPSFKRCVAVVRSRNIDVSIVVQSLSQLDDVYGKDAAVTIRENCPTTLFLGGGGGLSSAEQVSREAGKETDVKTSWSRRGAGLAAEQTRSRDSLGRDVFDPHEVRSLPFRKALVLMGGKEAILDDKSLVWECSRYDPRYMARDPELSFDYAAWREAGRPLGEAALAWERGLRR